uniref:Uncharacterized protein n=1 Tax=Mycobacterium riyadhense TaxID=486698 RepID=A0A653EI90_9MYCO|nr:hypothetical protein BIN_B_01973 [Mycobacterium riyadhense]
MPQLLVHGKYIQFVHDDNWLLPGALQTLARCFEDDAVWVDGVRPGRFNPPNSSAKSCTLSREPKRLR